MRFTLDTIRMAHTLNTALGEMASPITPTRAGQREAALVAVSAHDRFLADVREAMRQVTDRTFTHRDQMEGYLIRHRESEIGRALTRVELDIAHPVVVCVWRDYARARDISVTAIAQPEPQRRPCLICGRTINPDARLQCSGCAA